LYDRLPDPVKITGGTAYRYLADVIYPEGINSADNSDNFMLF